MWKIVAVAVLFAGHAFAEEPLGPSGLPTHAPFSLVTEEYVADYKASTRCNGSPEAGDVVSKGAIAIYYKPKNGEVEVLLDEYARRMLIDYCQ